jgi:hypothetical protein
MKMQCCLACAAALAIFAVWAPVSAQVYKWTDKKGTVHFTDNPEELPEPMRSEALRKLREEREKKKEQDKLRPAVPPPSVQRPTPLPSAQPAQPTQPATTSSQPASPRGTKAQWQERMSRARSRVRDLEVKCSRLESESQRGSRDSLLFARPGDREKAQRASQELKSCRESLKKAKHHLDEELPEQARRQGVPPGWLR